MSCQIRSERADDQDAIRRVHPDAFEGDAEARLVDLLRDKGRAVISLVAVEADAVVGHILFSPVTIGGSPDGRALALAPVGVLKAFHGRGIGSSLIREGLKRCRSAGYELAVVLGGASHYQRFGFQTAKQHGLDNEYGVDDEFMVLELQEGGLDRAGGLVQYAPEFKDVSC